MNIGVLLNKGYETLKNAGIESYKLDCQLLLGLVINKERLSILTNRVEEVREEDAVRYFELIALRAKRMPVKYILGQCEFMGLNMDIAQGVLIPRPDTEVLVEDTIKEMKQNGFKRVCDLCAGSGAIAIAIAVYVEDAQVVCYDISEEAEIVTNKNIDKFKLNERVAFIHSDLLEDAISKGKKFDVIVSNPPYIRADVIPTLMEDVREYEPYRALCGGEDGLEFYRKITAQSLELLEVGGLLTFEIGYDQGQAVQDILISYGFQAVECIKDLATDDRVVKGRLFN